jgi:hypothetical protein
MPEKRIQFNLGQAIQNQLLSDGITLEQITYYDRNGITAVSNNNNVVKRDEAGNIDIEDDSNLLIIEPIDIKITNRSMLRVLDTQFNHFKFPARIAIEEEPDLDLDLDLDFSGLETQQDIIFARYKPSENRRLALPVDENLKFQGLLFDEVVEGTPQKNTNSYFITKEIKNSGVDLRFRIQIQHRFDAPQEGNGTAFFSLILNSPDRGIIREWRGPFANTSTKYPSIYGSIGQYQVQTLNIDLIIPNSDFEIGERIGIGGFAGQNNESEFHTINADQSYWVVTDAAKNVDLWNQEIS